ncbi:MAG: hypothetical protein IPK16_27375 [Anaerolineales bacterium]|nr:hypothetical protein [Anaerolineales bacterium]
MIGYEHVGQTMLADELPTQRRHAVTETEENIRDILMAAGLQDTVNYALTSPENHDRLAPGQKTTDADYIALANPIAGERRVMRQTLLVTALENVQYNLRYTDRLAFFEVGRVYLPEGGDGVLPVEDRRLVLVMAGPRQARDFYHPGDSAEVMDFGDLKGVVELLFERLGYKAADVEFRAKPDTNVFGPRCAEVFLVGESLGLMGEIHPRVRAAFDLPGQVRIAAAELRILPLVRPQWQLDPMRPISSMPPVVEDLAFVVGEEITLRQVENAIKAAGGDLLVDLELFDLYRGEPLPAGSKSLAFRAIYQSQDSNLRDADIVKLRERIVRRVERETGGKLRG